jgi:hypothetical protein
MIVLSPMFWLGVYAQAAQYLIVGDPPEVTRADLGHLGGDPHFRPPAYDQVVATLQGIASRAAAPAIGPQP